MNGMIHTHDRTHPPSRTERKGRTILKRIIAWIVSALLLFGAVPAFGEDISATDTAQNIDAAFAGFTPQELLQQWYQIGMLLRADGLYPFVELEKGDVGYEVTALQTRLKELGYYKKTIVDNFGNGTYNAMRDFEKANGLKVNGKASAKDQIVLFSGAAMAYAKQTASSSKSNNSSSDDSDATSGATAETP